MLFHIKNVTLHITHIGTAEFISAIEFPFPSVYSEDCFHFDECVLSEC